MNKINRLINQITEPIHTSLHKGLFIIVCIMVLVLGSARIGYSKENSIVLANWKNPSLELSNNNDKEKIKKLLQEVADIAQSCSSSSSRKDVMTCLSKEFIKKGLFSKYWHTAKFKYLKDMIMCVALSYTNLSDPCKDCFSLKKDHNGKIIGFTGYGPCERAASDRYNNHFKQECCDLGWYECLVESVGDVGGCNIQKNNCYYANPET